MRRLLLAACLVLSAAPSGAQETAVVANRTIYPGETIEARVLEEIVPKRGAKPRGAVVRVSAELEGKVARRTILPGRYISPAAVREPYLVERGTRVQLRFSLGALVISATGVPLESGVAGDVLKVRNLDSGRIVSGTVMADGSVQVGAS